MTEHGQESAAQSGSSNMAATAPFQQTHMPGGHMVSGMHHEINAMDNDPQQNMNLRDYGLFSLDNQNLERIPLDTNQESILNQNDSHYLQNFFDNPNIITQPFNPFDFMPSGNGKSAANANTSLHGSFFDHNSGTINYSSPSQRGNPHGRSPPARPADALSADDYTAASTIHNFKVTSSSNYSQPSENGLGSASWGAFMMPVSMPLNISMGSNFPTSNNVQQYFAHPQSMPLTASFTDLPRGHQQSLPQSPQQRPHFYQHDRPQPLSEQIPQQQTDWQRPQSGSDISHRPQPYQFGSDQSFDGTHYSNPSSASEAERKANNLLGIPWAQQVARTPQQPQQRAESATSSIHPHWAGIRSVPDSGRFPEQQEHKRLKTQISSPPLESQKSCSNKKGSAGEGMEDEEESEPGKPPFKRRKSNQLQREASASDMQIPQSDDAMSLATRRGLKKARETLSDAQKRDNHIQSEKKRRTIINNGYEELNKLTPSLTSGKSGLSRSECLQEIACFLESVVEANGNVLDALGLSQEDLANLPSAVRSSPVPAHVNSGDDNFPAA